MCLYTSLIGETNELRSVIRVGLVSAGDFGTSLLAQVQCISNLETVVVCDTNLAQIDAAIASAGVD